MESNPYPTSTTILKILTLLSSLKQKSAYHIRNSIAVLSFIGLILIPIFSIAAPPSDISIQHLNKNGVNTSPGNVHTKRRNVKNWAKGRILVMPRAGLPAQALDNILKEHDGKARKIGQSELYVVDLPEYTEEGAITRLAYHPHLKFAELDYSYHLSTTATNDPYFSTAWHLPKIGAPDAWDFSLGEDITIAILDTGIDSAHPDLAERIIPGWNFYDNNSDTSDVHGHGTAVAGAAAAANDNGIGVASVTGQSKIMPVRIASPDAIAYGSTMAEGLTWAADNGVRIANISYSGVPGSLTVINAAQYMKNKNGLVIVAAGNAGQAEGYSSTTTMIPVSATNTADTLTSWSSYGNYVTMSAPGVDIWTTYPNANYGLAAGTSLASPITAGTVALMMAANPAMKNTDIEDTLFSTALDLGADGWDPYYGHGRVDAAAAVQAVVTDTPEMDTEAPVVSIVDPVTGETVSGLVPVDIEAMDNVGVDYTELWADNTKVAVDSTEPFAFTWDSNGVENGTASLVVRAYDAAGNVGISDIVDVTVDNPVTTVDEDTEPPVVEIINPVEGNVSHRVRITINASDDSSASGIRLAIYIDGRLEAVGAGSTLSTIWNTRPRHVSKGQHVIEARAADVAGNSSAAFVTVNVVK